MVKAVLPAQISPESEGGRCAKKIERNRNNILNPPLRKIKPNKSNKTLLSVVLSKMISEVKY